MRAAGVFAQDLQRRGLLRRVERIECELYGSLGATGIGHHTPRAVAAGLAGLAPETIEGDTLEALWAGCLGGGGLDVMGGAAHVPWDGSTVRLKPRVRLERHPNALRLVATAAGGTALADAVYYSVGGGFIEGPGVDEAAQVTADQVPYPFVSAVELLDWTERLGWSIAAVARANEEALHGVEGLRRGLDGIGGAMEACVRQGMTAQGVLPGGLEVPRRAARLAGHLREHSDQAMADLPGQWLQVYALAVSEENAAGHRVVTAPTNGAAGIVPAVMTYARRWCRPVAGDHDFLLTAGAIGALYKANGSISGAEAGCQGEVGVAASMAAGGLAAVLGGSPEQVENAAEIAMEHNLGLTCDPVRGLVQLPCIERNAVAAGVAVSAAMLALAGDGRHRISLDTVIQTMLQTGRDMSEKYKETALGGLAVSFVEC